MKDWKNLLYLLLILAVANPVWAQEDDEWDDWDDRTEEEIAADKAAASFWEDVKENEKKGLYAGIYVGTLFSDSYSARNYDGYGFDLDGQPNTFANSWLLNRINILSNPASGGGDQIAEALGVGPGEWSFDETDMATNMTYNIAFSFGLQGRYNFDSKNALLFNLNFSQLTTNGQFTIELLTTQPGSNPANPGELNFPQGITTHGIRGREQRVGLQIGYQRILGNHENFNWFVEGGVDVTFAKFDGNWAQINDLEIDLTIRPNIFGQTLMTERNLTGAAVGAFGGFGGQLESGGKWTIQLVVNPLFQRIALSTDTRYGFHLMAGLRAIYNI